MKTRKWKCLLVLIWIERNENWGNNNWVTVVLVTSGSREGSCVWSALPPPSNLDWCALNALPVSSSPQRYHTTYFHDNPIQSCGCLLWTIRNSSVSSRTRCLNLCEYKYDVIIFIIKRVKPYFLSWLDRRSPIFNIMN